MSVVRTLGRSLVSPLSSSTRGSLPWEDGGGGALWTPARASGALLWWDPSVLAAGAVASWTDRIAGVAATQATGTKQPTQSATAIGNTYPGVSADGGDELVAAGAGAVLSGKTTLTIVMAMVDASTTASIALELTANATANDGGLYIAPNDGSAGLIRGAVRGTSSSTIRSIPEALATVKVVSMAFDFATAGANAIPWVRVNGTAATVTTAASASAAGSAANASLYFFARGGALTAPYTGTLGDIFIRNSIAQDADLARAESFIGARCGLSW